MAARDTPESAAEASAGAWAMMPGAPSAPQQGAMAPLRPSVILGWALLPTAVFGRVSLLLSLISCRYLAATGRPDGTEQLGAGVFLAGRLAQAGGFFLPVATGKPGKPSAGTTLTTGGAVLLATAVLLLVYGLVTRWAP